MGENGNATSAGSISLQLRLNTSGIQSGLNNIKQRVKTVGQSIKEGFNRRPVQDFGTEVERTGGRISKLKSALGGFAKGVIAAFSVAAILKMGSACAKLASDLNEVENVTQTAFPKMSGFIDEWSKNALSKFGLTERMAKQYVGTFGSMSQAFGFTEKQAAAMGTTLAGLAGDVASFYNISQDEAYTKLKSVFTGETESLKDLGVVMTQTALDSYALANGFGKTTQQMSEAEKVALRYSFVQSKLTMAQGDVARTTNSWANQIRLLKGQIQTLGSMVGQLIIKVLSPLVQALNFVLGKIIAVGNAFGAALGIKVKQAADSSKKAVSGLTGEIEGISDGYDAAANTAQKTTSATNKLAKAAKKAAAAARGLMGFDQMNKLTKEESDSAGASDTSAGGAGTSASITSGSIVPNIDTSPIDNFKQAVDGKLSPIWNKLIGSFRKVGKEAKALGDVLGKAFKWVWENILKPFGNWIITAFAPAFAKVLASALKVVKTALEALGPVLMRVWENGGKQLAEALGQKLLKALEWIAGKLEDLAKWIKKNPDLFALIVTSVLALVAAFTLALTIVSIVTTISNTFRAISGIFTTLFNPTVLIVVGIIAALVAAGVLLYQNWDVIKPKLDAFAKFFNDKWQWIKDKVYKLVDAVIGILGKLKDLWDGFKDKAVQFIADAKEKVKGALDALKQKWDSFKDKTVELAMKAKQKAAEIAQWWKDRAAEWKEKIVDFAAKAKNKVAEVAGWWKDRAAEWKEKAVDFAVKAKNKTAEIAGWWKDRATEWKEKAVDFAVKAKNKVAEIAGWWKDRAAEWKEKATNFAVKAKNAASEIAGWWKERAKQWPDKVSNLVNKATTTAQRVKEWWKSNTSPWQDKVMQLGGKVAQHLAQTVSNAWTNVSSYWKDKLASWGIQFPKGITDWIDRTWRNLITWFPDYVAEWGIKFSAVGDDIKNWLNWNILLPINKAIGSIPLLGNIQIPYFANGAYLQKNTPTLAMVGDNRHEGEYVAPESKLQAMADRAAANAGSNNDETNSLLRQLIAIVAAQDSNVYLDGREIAKSTVRHINAETRRTGVCEIMT